MLKDRHLIPLKPELYNHFACPECGAEGPEGIRAMVLGKQTAAEYKCHACGLAFVRDLPTGFTIDLPIAWRLSDKHPYHPPNGIAEDWAAYPDYQVPRTERYDVQRKIFKEYKRIVVLNTIDHLYGHVLLKLFNAQHYLDKHPDIGLVVIVPRMFEWLVPEGVAESWVFDIKLKQAWGWNAGVDAFVQEQWDRYDEIYLAPGYSHPEFSKIDIERFSRIAPFKPEEFLVKPPHITFVARRDRLWYSSPFTKLAHRMLKKIGLFADIAVWWQDRMVASAIRKVRKQIPQARFTVVGLAKPGGMPDGVEDLRTMNMDLETELGWCRAYAKSQIAVGVHGSNMILPTAHAAGCVEILPYDRYGNIVQDISVRYADRMQLFMYRFTDEFAPPRDVARHIVSMFKDHEVYRLDNQVNIFRSE
ncbi:MAG: hypothetical protein IPL81_14975 [Flavobacteriales bacterium]|nr:hypothetical protein [Flavobacteriales bacterium]MBK7246781.1 hypothetical protein [Flavobacteriales bacterium]MBK7286669.1 hypothetical protein [Flavobacteriales bacterium]MBK9061103.1 hypothetical protein [Flavobacteriales bacterium]QQS72456.1 MAG: hypothetical protein IPP95_15005 [Flavobacteriales bacterium]